MTKRSRVNSQSEIISSVFERLFAIANSPKAADGATPDLGALRNLKRQALSAAAEEEEKIRKAATEFTFKEAVRTFGLTHSSIRSEYAKHLWQIEELSDVKTFQPSPCLESLLENYTAIYDRSSEAACRIAVDFLLCECISRSKASAISPTQPSEDGLRTPTPWDTVQVYCEVYLASLRQSRQKKGRSDTSVYGVATDGLCYVFLTITHEGVLKQSKQFDVWRRLVDCVGGLEVHLGDRDVYDPNFHAGEGNVEDSWGPMVMM